MSKELRNQFIALFALVIVAFGSLASYSSTVEKLGNANTKLVNETQEKSARIKELNGSQKELQSKVTKLKSDLEVKDKSYEKTISDLQAELNSIKTNFEAYKKEIEIDNN